MPEVGAASQPKAAPPVLFMVFNRPHLTREVFAAIRAARPARLYVAADGPRMGRTGEAQLCAQARAIATAVDWPCELRTLFRDANLGCRRAVSGAVSWLFEHETEGIILEDDCLPAPDFFRYCAIALEHWRDDPRVMHIGAHVVVPRPAPMALSRVVPVTGWATWRRAWAHYDDGMSSLQALRDMPLKTWFGAQGPRMRRVIEGVHDRRVDAWGARWVLSVWAANGYSVLPGANLISNLGYGPDATHTTQASHLAHWPLGSLPQQLEPPRDDAADAAYDEQYLNVTNPAGSMAWRVLRRLRDAAWSLAR